MQKLSHPPAEVKNLHFWLLVFGVLASTMLSALTLSRHRSAIRKNRPYGWCVALMVSALQLAPFVEMVDKLGDGVCWGLREEDLSSPLASVMSSIVMQTYSRPVELQVDAKSGKAFVFLMNFCCPESYVRNFLSSTGSQQFGFKRFKTTIQCRNERLSLWREPDARLAQAVNCKSTIDPAASCQQFQSLRRDVYTVYIMT